MTDNHIVKPDKGAFVGYRLFFRALILLVVVGVFFGFFGLSLSISFFYFLGAYVLIFLFLYYQLSVSYRKEEYIFYHDRVVRKGGGIFHDKRIELVVSNVTHVTARLPFIENSFFGTGSIRIESAGSGISEIVLRSIAKPHVYYKYVEKLMIQNGFKLSRDNLIQKERPCGIGVFLEALGGVQHSLGSVLFGLVFGLIATIALLVGMVMMMPFAFILLIPYFIFLISFVVRYLDISKRLYEIYDEVIVYSEGFLTKNYSFIPSENLSDSSLTQNLVDKIFGIYDVKISCQGTGQEIHFRNIKKGREMEKNIDSLVRDVKPLKKVDKTDIVAHKVVRKVDKVDVDTSYTGSMRMNMMRSLFFPLLLLVPLILGSIFAGFIFQVWLAWVVFTGYMVIAVKATEFVVGERSIERKYNFLSRNNIEFNCDKITGVNVKENFVDKWFGTVSVAFWSIGTGQNIVFKHVNKSADLVENLVSKAGVKNKEIIYEMNSDFSFGRMLKANLFSSIFVGIVMVASVVLAALVSVYSIGMFVFLIVVYSTSAIYLPIHYRRSKLKFYKDYVYFEKGVFFKNYYFSLFNNVKDIATVRYPASKYGLVRFNVAGETLGGGKNKVLVSNQFAIGYIDKVEVKDDLIDLIFDKRPSRDEVDKMENKIGDYVFKDLLVSRPDIGNAVLPLVLGSFIIFPLLLLLPFTLLFTIWSIKVKRYSLQNGRVVARWGIFYKSQISILYSKVDHINSSEGFLNKMFHNGNSSVNTTGSSAPELVISNIPNYKEFYKQLGERTRK